MHGTTHSTTHSKMNSGDPIKGKAKADTKLVKSLKATKGGLATSARSGSAGYKGDKLSGGSKNV